MQNNPILSIVTPVFNSKFLLRVLWGNLEDQNFDQLEWVVVNDGSSDLETLQILDEIDKSCEFASVYHLENGGAPAARNYGFSKTTGSYIKFLDADDFLAEDHLKIMGSQIDESLNNQFLISPQKILYDLEEGKRKTVIKPLKSSFIDAPIENSLFEFDFHHSSCFFSRELCGKVCWDESLTAYQDLDFLWNLMLLKPSFQIVSDTYFVNREHSFTDRITTKKSPEKWKSRVYAVTKLLGKVNWQQDERIKKAFDFRFNTLFLFAYFEDREAAKMILQEKKRVLQSRYDLDLVVRFIKEVIKKFINK